MISCKIVNDAYVYAYVNVHVVVFIDAPAYIVLIYFCIGFNLRCWIYISFNLQLCFYWLFILKFYCFTFYYTILKLMFFFHLTSTSSSWKINCNSKNKTLHFKKCKQLSFNLSTTFIFFWNLEKKQYHVN
jgi:hypothetical protein